MVGETIPVGMEPSFAQFTGYSGPERFAAERGLA
jgi:hypothetical protein